MKTTALSFAAILTCLPTGVCGSDLAKVQFDSKVAPILIRRCVTCHSGADAEGQLDLSTNRTSLAGGESGAVLVAGRPDESLLWNRVQCNEMPPEKPLAATEKAVLREWILSGLAWGTDPLDPFRFTTDKRAGYDWWALQRIREQSPPPALKKDRGARSEVDAFVWAKLAATDLSPSPSADRRTLIRRLTFDLLGLPPTPEEVAAFEADARPDAYERLVDRLLASPHYGARWARHWLDVARFGESEGFERDKIRENSWPYRDWVIDAFNQDMPYDDFARRQIAGDILDPENAASIIATGFLVAGPYDEVGQNQQSAAMKAVVRQDELEDIVAVVSQTFLGLTVNCARCHDHKFDPISQREYYQLTAALDGVRHGSRDVASPADRARTAALEAEVEALGKQLRDLDRELSGRVAAHRPEDSANASVPPLPLARWSFERGLEDAGGELHGHSTGNAAIDNGRLVLDGDVSFVATTPLLRDLREKTLEAWVQLDDLRQRGGGVIGVQTLDGETFDAIVFGEREPARWAAGSNSFRRTKSFDGPLESAAEEQAVHVAIAFHADGTIAAYRNGRRYGRVYKSSGPVTFTAGEAQVVFGLRHSPAGGNRLLRGAIEAANLYDRALTAEEVAQSAAVPTSAHLDEQLAAMTPSERAHRAALQARISALRAAMPPVFTSYAVNPRPPAVGQVLLRGNPANKGERVSADGIESLRGIDADFGLPPESSDADRRRRLAQWITDPSNPLFSRVVANRLWHHHFGVGLVETPNDFGFNGGRPSHPELIDYLARFLADSSWSLKALHRRIVCSATYRQSSRYRAGPAAVDAENRLLWRKSPARLEAEALRDTILSVAGHLNSQMGGPGYRDFETFIRNTQFYVMKDPIGKAYNRRSVYRTWIRSGRNRFLDVFDCPDPSTKTPRRMVTVTPIQALALMNNSFVLRMSGHLADRLRASSGADVQTQVRRAYQLSYGRNPDEQESREASVFVEAHGLSELCRVIFNSNEFLYVD